MKKLLCLLLCLILIAGTASCAAEGGSTATGSQAADVSSATVSEAPEPFTFQRKVCNTFLEGVFGKDMCDAWFNLVDAIYAGETTFACKDDHTCAWVLGQFPNMCLPAVQGYIFSGDRETGPDHPVKDGVAHINYSVSHEELMERITAFEAEIVKMLNEAMTSDMTDFEKALSLYKYCCDNFVYDYDAYNEMQDHAVNYTSPYRVLMEKIGICGDIGPAYSYLLMQAGVDAGCVGGHADWSAEGHEWSIVNLGGKYYHVDATFALSSGYSLEYFLMTDKQRVATGIREEEFDYCSHYSLEHPHPDFSCTDETYAILWGYQFMDWDRANKTVIVTKQYAEPDDDPTLRFKYE